MRARTTSGRLLGAAALMTAWALPTIVHAQAYDRVAPKSPPGAAAAPAVAAPDAPAPLPASDKVILPALKGLVFVSDPGALQKNGLVPSAAGQSGIAAPGLPLLADPAFEAQLSPYLGKPLTLAGLDKIAGAVTNWYRDHDQPFMAVAVPPQNISTGVVQMVVTPYRVGQVRAEGNRWFSSDLLVGESGIAPGQGLTLSGVQGDLDWLNANPFRTVTTLFEPGAAPGETDVVLKTEDRLPLRVYAGFDNAGVASLGRGEWSAGINWGNAFGLDQQLSYQFTRSFSTRFDAHSVSWTAPLPWRDKLIVFGSFEQERPNLGPSLDSLGQSGQASLRYVHDLPRVTPTPDIVLTQDIQVGYDFKTTDNNLEFGGFQVFGSSVEVSQFPIIYELNETDGYGQTAIENQFVISPGGMTGANNDAAFRKALPLSKADYVYDRIGFTRTTPLPDGITWVARVLGQLADTNLQYSEELGAGGPSSVRGYYTDAAIGSQGVLVSQEIRAPAFSLSRLLNQPLPVEDQLQLGAFWDWGHVVQVDDVPDRVNSATLSSLGVDAHLTLNRYLDFRVDSGWQLRAAPGAGDRSVFVDLAATVGF